MPDLETLEGIVTVLVYKTDDSLYKVYKVKNNNGETITVTGNFLELVIGFSYEFSGYYKEHSKYGKQFSAVTFIKKDSFTKQGLINYLSSEKFYGIGPKLAESIVDTLGLDAIKKIREDDTALVGIKGLTKAKKEALVTVIKNNYEADMVFIKLYSYGLTPKMIEKLYQAYGVLAASKIEENPYRLITEVEGYGFKKSDALSFKLGFKPESKERIRAAITYTVSYVCNNEGFTYITIDQLLNSVKNLLSDINLEDKYYKDAIDYLVTKKQLIVENDRAYDYILYNSEIAVKDRIVTISKTYPKFKHEKIEDTLNEVEPILKINFTPMQKEAIVNSLSSQLSIITGGPGTGKSTILKGILNVYSRLINTSLSDEDINYRIALASPTGRAAKRMTEVTCFKAQTIHKLLGYKGDNSFQKNKEEKMPYKLIIIDEVSMLDVNLAKALFEAIKDETQVILIGDYNQLPSVGPGNVLHDLMNSSYFKVTKLNQIMRQSQDSNIIKLSSMVLAESIDYRIFSTHKDVFFYNYSTKDCLDGIKKMLDAYIQSGGDIISNMQILAPMYKGPCGIDAINQMVQSNYNKEKDHILVRGNKIFKKNDKVLQLKNDTELEIMNGDIGRVIDVLKVDDKDVLYVDFDGKLINYPLKNLDDLTLAYAISIHKSQGSEFENVIMPVLTSYQIMLKKRIIYTGITRAKKKLIILGDKNALSYSLLKGDYERQTSLLELLNNENNIKSKQEKIYDPNIPFDTFGEYDMEGITPYTFMDK